MGVIHTEYFDSSSSIPSGWNSGSSGWSIRGSPYPTEITPTSSPNMLSGSTPSGMIFLTWGTADGNGGDVAVQCNVNTQAIGSPGVVGVTARGSASTLGASTSCYAAWINEIAGEIGITLWSGGSSNILGSLAVAGSVSGWATLVFALEGSTLSLAVQQYTTGKWLTPAGTWQASQTTALTISDSTLSGSGYSGVVCGPTSGTFTGYFDNYSLSTTGPTPGAASIAGLETSDIATIPASTCSGVLSSREVEDSSSFAGNLACIATVSTTGSDDAGTLVGRVETAILTRQESPDVAMAGGSVAANGFLATNEGPDVPAIHGFLPVAAIAGAEDRDGASLLGSSAAVAAAIAAERHDSASSVANIHNTTTFATVEFCDAAALSGSLSASGRFPAAEGRDHGSSVAISTLVSSVVAEEGADCAEIVSSALGIPPALQVREARDVAALQGSCPTLRYNIYVSPAPGVPIDYSTPVDVTADLTWTSRPLATPGAWSFGVRAADENGEEQNLDCSVIIELDAAGGDASNIAAPPIGLRAIATVGAGISVLWSYPTVRGPKTPIGFHVYAGIGGAPDYATPSATLAFDAGILGSWMARLTGLEDGVTYCIGVRAYNSSGEEGNTNAVFATADATGPQAVDSLTATAIV